MLPSMDWLAILYFSTLYREQQDFQKLLGSCEGASWKAGWRETSQQDATNPMFIIKILSQHVSGNIMPIIRRTRLCITAYGVLH